MNTVTLDLIKVIVSFITSGVLGFINVRILVLLGQIKENNKNDIAMFSALFSLINVILFYLVNWFLTTHLGVHNRKPIIVFSFITTIFVSYFLTFSIFDKLVSRVFRRVNRVRTKHGDTKIIKNSVEDEFYIKATGNAVFLYDFSNKEIAYGTITKAPFDKYEGNKYMMQPFSEEADLTSFEELNKAIHAGELKGYIYIDFDNKMKAIVIENDC